MLRVTLAIAAAALMAAAVTTTAIAADGPAKGYTYVEPSYCLTPAVLAAPPPVVLSPGQPVFLARPVYTPVVVMEPAFLHTTVMPYDPVWPYAYMGLPGNYYRERVDVDRGGVEYKLKSYGPRGARTVYSYEVDTTPYGVKVRERVR
jgi:hypothetical protein